MNLLHLFMLILFVFGILLIITTFSAYSKLSDMCKQETSGLRNKLRWAICLGTAFMTISISYLICINGSGCKCDFGEHSDWKIYSLLLIIVAMGGGMIALSIGIKSDLKKDNCNIDLGGLPDIILGISISLIVLAFIYLVYVAWSKNPKGTAKQESKEEPEEESFENKLRKAAAKKEIADSKRESAYMTEIASTEASISELKQKMEATKRRGKEPSTKDKEQLTIINNHIM